MTMILFKTIRFFVARQYNVNPKKVLKWGGAYYRMAEQSIMINPDPVVQSTANGFAMNVAMNQDKKSREEHGMVQDYHILPQLLTHHRKVAIIEVEKEEKENAVITKKNSNVVNMMLQGL